MISKFEAIARVVGQHIENGDFGHARKLVAWAATQAVSDAEKSAVAAMGARVSNATYWANSVSASVVADYATGNVQHIG